MIAIPGKLTVREIKGRKGAFMVGELATEVGGFKVKSTILDQFEPGTYSGTFLIANIYLDSYVWYGSLRAELCAKVHEINLDHEDLRAPTGEVLPEPDPADRRGDGTGGAPQAPVPPPAPAESPATVEVPAPAEALTPPDAPAASEGEGTGAVDADLELFGQELYAAIRKGEPVKLDPTIDRTKFRAQRDRLKSAQLGYEFKADSQSWLKKQ